MAHKKGNSSKKSEDRPRAPGQAPVDPEVLGNFLDHLCEYGNVSQAAFRAGVGRTTLYRHKKENPEFAAAWAEAEAIGNQALEDEAKRRAFSGWTEPVWSQGKRVMDAVIDPDTGLPMIDPETGEIQYEPAVIRKYSDTLLIFLLKGSNPEKFKDRVHQQHSAPDGGPVKMDLSGLDTKELRALKELLDKARTSGDRP